MDLAIPEKKPPKEGPSTEGSTLYCSCIILIDTIILSNYTNDAYILYLRVVEAQLGYEVLLPDAICARLHR
jgi:hypothetical protein